MGANAACGGGGAPSYGGMPKFWQARGVASYTVCTLLGVREK